MNQQLSLARLREAREARGLSLDELASRIGTSRQLIHRYEAGRVTPRPETFVRLCAALNVTPDFFALQAPANDVTPLFFRHFRSKATAKQLAAVRRQTIWLRDVVAAAEISVSLPKVDIPDFEPPVDPREITDAQIEQAATSLRREWGFGDGVIVEVTKLVESKGCVVVSGLVESQAIDAFSQLTRNGRPLIFINCRQVSAAHLRLDVAHELAHLIMHKRVDPRFVDLNPDTHKLIERQAFRFASAFLMPEATFRKSVPYVSLDSLLLVKTQWQLSVAAMLRRAEDLGMIDAVIARNLWINLTRRGWRQHEPLDDLITRDDPQVLKSAFVTMQRLRNGAITALSQKTGLPPADFERFAGLPENELVGGVVRDFDYFTRESIELGQRRA